MEISDKNSRYTLDGSDQFEARIQADMDLIVSEMLKQITDIKKVKALVLGGGYGRGEGGIALNESGEIPFNDYDFFVITGRISKKVRARLNEEFHDLHEMLTEIIGIDVDFGPVLSKQMLPKLPYYIMWYELKAGHRVVWGDKKILDVMPDYDPNQIPPEEAVKLMLNRTTGLILARDEFITKDEDSYEFILRNAMKARIAIGDAFLITKNLYSSSYIERRELLRKFENDFFLKDDEIMKVYAQAIGYKMRPDSVNFDYEDLRYLLEDTVEYFREFYLYAFEHYLDKEMEDWEQYYEVLDQSFVETSWKKKLKNIILNGRYYKFKNFKWKDYLRYPRLRLYMAMPYLLFKAPLEPRVLELINAEDDSIVLRKYLKLWNRFN